MARDAYLTLLTLGRHASEPAPSAAYRRYMQPTPSEDESLSEPAPPQDPEIEAARLQQEYLDQQKVVVVSKQRELRKAQTDVITTVGLHLHNPKDTKRAAKDEDDRENDVGLFLGGLDLVTIYAITWPLIALRNELQTFIGLEDVRYRDLLLLAFRERTALEWYAGMPSHIVFQLINVLREYGQSLFFRWLRRKKPFKDPKTGKPRRRLLNILYKSITIAAWFYVYPIYRHSVLQSLHLIPPRPILPHYTALLPFMRSIPTSSSALSAVAKKIINSRTYLESYFFWSLLQQKLAFRIHLTFLNLFSARLPRPDTADVIATSSGGFAIGEADYDDFFSEDEDDLPTSIAAATRATDDTSDDGVTQTFTATVQLADTSNSNGSTEAMTNGVADDHDINATISEIEVQVTTTSTRDARPPRSSSLVNGTGHGGREPRYRSTTLASHPSDVISSHAADAFASTLTVGLESMVMSSIALGYLSHDSHVGVVLPRSNLVGLAHRTGLIRLGLGLGMGPRTVGDLGVGGVYRPTQIIGGWSQVFKGLVLEWGVAWGLFEVAYWATTFVGLKWFGYRAMV